ncbi:hypothetical protein [Pseudoduganella rhizocola]|uniref:hypothetical protein n=1 Tax=Pseudoduganella rhizocola TaxID=3382643 RepID=UPI0038B55862
MSFRISFVTAAVLACSLPAAATELVVIVNPQNPATRMFNSQASQFFLGKSTMFTPVEHSESSPIRAEFYRKVLEKDASQVKALWSKLVLTGKAAAPREYASSAEVKKAVAASPNAIGYIEKAAVDETVKVVLTVQ